ncbi:MULTISPECIES: hypothetical protein [Actinomadura]|uniref:Tryptophan-associated transmembrane protein (Trp_oprn_chp) n=1 Tax=Actinomadura yumaensis TaxID=111807 RepID=A0ABW2D183_9ACTN|nr:hypothetical protein [Actinomadura sp. J1-007]MWK38032.1 hypothetical protein [Actinomadura sp. J1-007]
MTGTMRVPRTRGVLSGVLLVLLGLWGGLLPFVGPYLDFGFAPDETWVYDTDRLQLSVAPAVAVGLGGLIVLLAANRAFAMAGAWLAVLGGGWFAVGPTVATLWDVDGVGAPLGTEEGHRVAEQLAGFTALGVVAVFLAAVALGRFAVVGVREADAARAAAAEEAEGPAWTGRPGGAGTTQPIAPTQGRYGRDAQAGRHAGGPAPAVPRQAPPDPAPPDQRVAPEPGERPHG